MWNDAVLRIIKMATKWLAFTALALLWLIQILQLNLSGGMFMLLFSISLAVARAGNRLVWCFIFGLMTFAIVALDKQLPSFPRVEQGNFWYALTFFILMVLVPAGVIWLAQMFATYKSRAHH